MTTFALDGRMVLTTKSGGRVRYQAEQVNIIEIGFTLLLFFAGLLWGAFQLEMNSHPQQIRALPAPPVIRSWRGSGAGRLWVRHYLLGVLGV